MTNPLELPLFGFANPQERLPAFLIPIFGTVSYLWIQDGRGRGDGLVSGFSPSTLPPERIVPERGRKQLSARVGDALIYAFQFPTGEIEIGPRSVIHSVLSERLNEFQNSPFLIIDILKFIERSDALSGAIQKAKDKLATSDPQIAEQWALSMRGEEGLDMVSKSLATQRVLITDGPHTQEVLKVLDKDLGKSGIAVALQKATRIIELAVNPLGGPPAEPSDGLLYGLIQSGKTSILTVSAAMAADNRFDCILVLTSDI